MDVDAAQYASMSREMWERKDWLNLYDRGAPYLDKPPLLFWLGSIGIGLFGYFDWAFKLPSVLLSYLGLYSTYRLALLFYSRQVAANAAIILAATQAWFLMNHDVRTDMLLTVWVIFSVWQLAEYLLFYKTRNLLLAFAGIGLGMLSKGPLALILPAAGVFFHLLFKRGWRDMFRWQWVAGLGVTLLVISPFLYSLYQQFDLHPEVKVNERTGVSGIRFFLWEQSFGRITGENVWKNDAGPSFLSESTLWAFLPFTLLLLTALPGFVLRFFSKNEKRPPELLTMSIFLFGMAALSSSSYQLPHYAFVTYPFAAIFTASQWDYWQNQNISKALSIAQMVILGILWIGIFLILFLVFGAAAWWLWVIMAAILFLIFTFIYRYHLSAVINVSALTAVAVNLTLALHFYPNVLRYQASSVMGKEVAGEELPNLTGFMTAVPHSFSFYSGKKFEYWPDSPWHTLIESGKTYTFITNTRGKEVLMAAGVTSESEKFYLNFKVTELTPEFLNPATRSACLDTIWLIRGATRP